MKVKTNRFFYDVVEDTYRKEGDEFEVTRERFDELNAKVAGFVEEVYDLETMTVADMKKALDAQGIEYDPKAKKEELKALLK